MQGSQKEPTGTIFDDLEGSPAKEGKKRTIQPLTEEERAELMKHGKFVSFKTDREA